MEFSQLIEAIRTNYPIVVLFLAIIGYIFNIARKISKLEQSERIYEEKLKTLELKYDAAEKIKQLESDVRLLSAESKTEKDHIREHVYNIVNLLSDKTSTLESRYDKLESRIKSLDDEMKAHNTIHPPAHQSSAD